MKSFNLFPTLVKEFSVKGYPKKEKLLSAIDSYPTTNHSAVKGGKSSFYVNNSSSNFLKEQSFSDLESYFTECVKDYSKEIGILPKPLDNCWFNIMEEANFTSAHNHPGSSIAGAYYPLLEENTCNLVFHSPISPLQSAWFQEGDSFSLYHAIEYPLKIKQDHLYLFPGWLSHSTEVNKGGKRIVVSFNVVPWSN